MPIRLGKIWRIMAFKDLPFYRPHYRTFLNSHLVNTKQIACMLIFTAFCGFLRSLNRYFPPENNAICCFCHLLCHQKRIWSWHWFRQYQQLRHSWQKKNTKGGDRRCCRTCVPFSCGDVFFHPVYVDRKGVLCLAQVTSARGEANKGGQFRSA